jgi:hypothetical protein
MLLAGRDMKLQDEQRDDDGEDAVAESVEATFRLVAQEHLRWAHT